MSPRRFRVAFSFAGEKRDFVAKVAALLAKKLSEDAILYDKNLTAEFSHADLAFDLPELYHTQADLIVVVLCPDYDKKDWCGLEWRAIFDLIKRGHTKQVMLTRFGYVEGKGLYSLAGYTDLEEGAEESTAALILERLALNDRNTSNHEVISSTSLKASFRVGDQQVRVRNKRHIRYFISYAREDGALSAKLLAALQSHFRACNRYDFGVGQVDVIETGVDWKRSDRSTADVCDFGLLLVSPNFLGNTSVTEQKLKHLVAEPNASIPVAIRRVIFNSHDFKGLNPPDIFHYLSPRSCDGRPFGECNPTHQDKFATDLFQQILRRLDRQIGMGGAET